MESTIREIIKEELARVLLEIHEPEVYSQNEDEIIYSFDEGKAFGKDRLAREIRGLEEYYMNDYFPRSEMQENWMFEIDNYGGNQLVEIVHIVSDVSYWVLNIANLTKGSNVPEITKTTGKVHGYKNFIDRVNQPDIQKEINPSSL